MTETSRDFTSICWKVSHITLQKTNAIHIYTVYVNITLVHFSFISVYCINNRSEKMSTIFLVKTVCVSNYLIQCTHTTKCMYHYVKNVISVTGNMTSSSSDKQPNRSPWLLTCNECTDVWFLGIDNVGGACESSGRCCKTCRTETLPVHFCYCESRENILQTIFPIPISY